MPVKVTAGGTHQYAMRQFEDAGAAELIEQTLRVAGLDTSKLWNLQVYKRIHGGPQMDPISVWGTPKKHAVILKVRPGDNDTAHMCGLLVPSGSKGEDIYKSIRPAVELVSQGWNKKLRKHHKQESTVTNLVSEPSRTQETFEIAPVETTTTGDGLVHVPCMKHPMVPMPAHPVCAPMPMPEPEPELPAIQPPASKYNSRHPDLCGWLKDPANERLLLAVMYDTQKDVVDDYKHYNEIIMNKLGWEGMSNAQMGGLFTGLGKKDLVVLKMKGSKRVGYILSDAGEAVIADIVGLPVKKKAVAPAPAPDLLSVLQSVTALADKLRDSGGRIRDITTREQELQKAQADIAAELELLNEEKLRLASVLQQGDVRQLLAGLSTLVK